MSRATCDFRNCKALATVISSGNKVLCKTHGQYFSSLINGQDAHKYTKEDVELMELRIKDFLEKLVNEEQVTDQ